MLTLHAAIFFTKKQKLQTYLH